LDFAYKLREDEMKDRWEIMRLQTFYLINLQLKPENALQDVTELMKFKWDQDQAKEIIEPDWNELENQLYKGT
jgi:hypothetical protein